MALPQTTTVTGSILDATGSPITDAAHIYFQPVSNTGIPLSPSFGGNVISEAAVSVAVVNGVFTVSLLDTQGAGISPQKFGYRVTATNDVSGKAIIDPKGYACFQPTGSSMVLTANYAAQITVQFGPIGRSLNFRGAYDATATYEAQDVVSVATVTPPYSAVCLVDGTTAAPIGGGLAPAAGAPWQRLATDGVSGVDPSAIAALTATIPPVGLNQLYNKDASDAVLNSVLQVAGDQPGTAHAFNGISTSGRTRILPGQTFICSQPIFGDGDRYGIAYVDVHGNILAAQTAALGANTPRTAPNVAGIVGMIFGTQDSGNPDTVKPNLMLNLGSVLLPYESFGVYPRSTVDALIAAAIAGFSAPLSPAAVLHLTSIVPAPGLNQLYNQAAPDVALNSALHVAGDAPGKLEPVGGFSVSGRTFMLPGATFTSSQPLFGDGDRYGIAFRDITDKIVAYQLTPLAANTPCVVPNVAGIVAMSFTTQDQGNPDIVKPSLMINFGSTPLPYESFGPYPRNLVDAKIASATSPLPFKAPRRLALKSTDKVQLYGDSISSTLYPWYRQAMINLTGADVYADGYPGYRTNLLACDAQINTIYNRAPRLIFILCGGNDTGVAGTVGTFNGSVPGETIQQPTDITKDYAAPNNSDGSTGGQDHSGFQGNTYVQALDHLLRKLRARYNNIRANAGLTGSEDEPTKNAMIAASVNPMLVLLTSTPQNRTNAADPSSSPANRLRLSQGAIEVGIRNRVHTIDLYQAMALDMSIEPFYGTTGNPGNPVTQNNGVYFVDGLHWNQFLAARVASTIVPDSGQ